MGFMPTSGVGELVVAGLIDWWASPMEKRCDDKVKKGDQREKKEGAIVLEE